MADPRPSTLDNLALTEDVIPRRSEIAPRTIASVKKRANRTGVEISSNRCAINVATATMTNVPPR